MKLAIIGASGRIGSQIASEALSRGHSITAVARNPEQVAAQAGVEAVRGDLHDSASIIPSLKGQDAVISAVRFRSFEPPQLIEAVRKASVVRLLIVGGAGSLEVRPGVALIDTPEFPAASKEEGQAGSLMLAALRAERHLDWSFLSPSAVIRPGERTGRFRLGGDQLLVGPDGKSSISIPDYAIAMIDELERPKHIRQRFTVGY